MIKRGTLDILLTSILHTSHSCTPHIRPQKKFTRKTQDISFSFIQAMCILVSTIKCTFKPCVYWYDVHTTTKTGCAHTTIYNVHYIVIMHCTCVHEPLRHTYTPTTTLCTIYSTRCNLEMFTLDIYVCIYRIPVRRPLLNITYLVHTKCAQSHLLVCTHVHYRYVHVHCHLSIYTMFSASHIMYTCTRERYVHVHCYLSIQTGYTTTCIPLYQL